MLHDIIRLDERLIVKELERRGVRYTLINVDSLVYDVSKDPNPSSEVSLVRTVSQSKGLMLAHVLEEHGHVVVNSSRCLEIGSNKLYTLVRLSRGGVPVPRTYVITADGSDSLSSVKLSGMIVVKPVHGSWGRLVSLLVSRSELELLLRHRCAMESPHMRIVLVQEYIEKPNRDIRVIVVSGRAVAGIYRYSRGRDWRTNTARGGIARPLEITREIEEISVRACELVGAHYAGVDLVENGDGYKVLEVNVVPEFKNVVRVTGVNVAEKIVDMLLELARR